ncbi:MULTISPECIES: hypothetical protein [unclassified Moraxella]|uniref:hypothetical protein n=1 Tax=unclassified Moraxella TaxID=2685852 RepID=UPI003AF8E84A
MQLFLDFTTLATSLGLPSPYTPSWQALYVAGTVIVGLFISYESLLLKRYQGKMPDSSLFHFSSMLETVWSIVSIAVLYFADFSPLFKVVPVAYILYSLFGWLYGFYLLKDTDIDIDDIENIQMPSKYMDYSLSFSMVIILTSLSILTKSYLSGEFLLKMS